MCYTVKRAYTLSMADKCLWLLADDSPLTSRQLHIRCGIPTDAEAATLRSALRYLVQTKKIVRLERGLYGAVTR